ncbi:MAG TPA: nitronate monooxygenase [Gaiellaceae bacterium]|nr:nitronate monooxygenase [Gaiellaceae bacterium]
MRTPLCDLLGIEHPIVQAPIGTAAVPALAAAVSNAGALGMVALSWTNDVERAIVETRALTARPFGVNLLLEWDQRGRLEEALAAGARIVSTAWGDAAGYADRVREAGGLLVHTVASAAEARAADADVLVAQGWEAGGHVAGEVATLPLVPAVVDAVDVPVVAAGGIGDGRGIAAALALGAQAAWLGTRFVLAEEAPVHDDYRRRLIDADEADTVWLADLFDVGWPDAPHRALRNSTVEAWESAGRPRPGTRPGEGEVVARRADGREIVRYTSGVPPAGADGEIEALSLWAGQSVGVVREVKPAAEIVGDLVRETEEAVRRLSATTGSAGAPAERRPAPGRCAR